MAAGTILNVLTNIPWGTVVENAPKVADGAAKLWGSVTRRNKPDAVQDGKTDAASPRTLSETELLSARLQAAEHSVRQLGDQLRDSAALVKAMADQHTVLVARVELNRLRLVRLAAAAGGTAVALLGLNLYLLFAR